MKTPATMLGLAIGDALGQPFEFSTTEKIIASGWKGDLIGGSYGFEGMWKDSKLWK
jgi:ADP-ribosylglycohydrolase